MPEPEETLAKVITTPIIMTVRIAHTLVWLIFAVVHLSLVAAFLVLFWCVNLSPHDIQIAVAQFRHQSRLFSTIEAFLAFLGLSGLAVVWGYAKLWRRVMRRWLSSFLLAPPIS